jgi:ribosome maturation factor RimP
VKQEKIVLQVWDLIEPLCEAEGMELVQVEYQREAGGKVLRLFIDRPGGVTLDDCVQISRQAGDVLEVGLENVGPYNLEVSSPGTNRPLAKQLDYERFKGRQAKIKTIRALDGQKNFRGVLAGISEGRVKLSVEGNTITIPFMEIAKAHLVE